MGMTDKQIILDDWEDVKLLVHLADTTLEKYDKKDLLKMGEEGYYKEIFDAYIKLRPIF